MPGGLTREEISTGKRKPIPRQRKARRLAILPEEIKALIANTPRKARGPTVQEEVLEASIIHKESHTLNILVEDKVYKIETPPCSIEILEEHQLMIEIMTKFGEHAQISNFMEED